MKIFLALLIFIPSIIYGETLYLCETIVGKEYSMNSTTGQHINYPWGEGSFIIKKNNEVIS